MEYEKKDYQRSEGRLRSMGKESRDKEKRLSAYRPAEQDKTQERRPNEMMRMESSYGGIALGANRRQKMTMVVHEKRRSRGPGLKKDNREVDGGRTASISELRGNFRTNSHSRRDSAFVYEEALGESPLRMMERIQEMMDENYQRSGEQVLPFLNRKKDKEEAREIREKLRESQETDDRVAYGLWNRRQGEFRKEETEKREMRRRFYRELLFTREKSRKLLHSPAPAVREELWIKEEKAPAGAGEEEKPESGAEQEDEKKNLRK